MGLNLFGSSKKQSSTNKTTASTGYGEAAGEQSSVIAGLTAADGSTINLSTDSHGAIEAGRDLALRAIDAQESAFDKLFAGQAEQSAAALQLATVAQQSDGESTAEEFRKLVTVLAVAAGAVVLVMMFKRG
jgi:hypothetical protein